jgi:hypothetical protein
MSTDLPKIVIVPVEHRISIVYAKHDNLDVGGRETPLSKSDVAKLSLVQDSKDHCLCEAGDLDRPDLIAGEHFGGIAGIPHIDSEWTKPFCAAQSVRGLRIRAAHKRQ